MPSSRSSKKRPAAYLGLFAVILAAVAFFIPSRSGEPIPPDICFYHWKTVYDPGREEKEILQAARSPRLYMRFFDVGLAPGNGRNTDRNDRQSNNLGDSLNGGQNNNPGSGRNTPDGVQSDSRDNTPGGDSNNSSGDGPSNAPVSLVPIGTLALRQKSDIPLAPVVFINNQDFKRISEDEVPVLAARIVGRVKAILEGNKLPSAYELQIDCDWAPSTKDRFFHLLEEVRAELQKQFTGQAWTLSATLRLYQYRHPAQAGVPPVDRVALMAYNMGDLTRFGDHNSIIDEKTLAPYLKGKKYPLPIDVALPLFEWAVLFSPDCKYRGIFREIPAELADPEKWEPVENTSNLFKARVDQNITGNAVSSGSFLRVEKTTAQSLKNAARMVAESTGPVQRVIFFHLDRELLESLPLDIVKQAATSFTKEN